MNENPTPPTPSQSLKSDCCNADILPKKEDGQFTMMCSVCGKFCNPRPENPEKFYSLEEKVKELTDKLSKAEKETKAPSQSSRERAKALVGMIRNNILGAQLAEEQLTQIYDQIAALEADKRRIDWLEKYLKVSELVGNDVRQSIDAAIAQSK